MFKTLAAAMCLSLPTFAQASDMTFELECAGNAVESCYVIAQGTITKDTPKRFSEFWGTGQIDGNQILLNSPGGSLSAGVALGRVFRSLNLNTVVGNGDAVRNRTGLPGPATCQSACAYAFVGGNNRHLTEGSKLGFHRFFIKGQTMDGHSAQSVSGGLIRYLIEMNVDARVFSLASTAGEGEMYFVPAEEAEEYDLVTPHGYQDFFLEPYGNGVVAASVRKTKTDPYDLVQQVTAFCKKGKAKLLFYAPQHGLSQSDPVDMIVNTDTKNLTVAAKNVKIRASKQQAYLEVSLPKDIANAISGAKTLATGFRFSRAEGGSYSTHFELSDMDRKMLSAAFRLCL